MKNNVNMCPKCKSTNLVYQPINEVHLKNDNDSHTFINEKEMLIKILSLDKLNIAEFNIKELDVYGGYVLVGLVG